MTEFLPIALMLGLLGMTQAKRSWRELTYAAVFATVYEGAFRKWLLPSLQGPLYFVKDGILVLALAGFLLNRREFGVHERLNGPIKVFLVVLAPFCIVEAFNPNLPSFLLGILGLKSYLLYIVFAFIVPYAFHSAQDLQRKLATFMIFMIPVAVLGLVQFSLPADHWLNTYVQQDVDRAVIISQFGDSGNHVRTSGTFSYIGGYATFVQAMFALALGASISARGRSRYAWVSLILLGACSFAMFTTGSRTTVYGCALIAVIVTIVSMWSGAMTAKTFTRGLLFGALITASSLYLAVDAIDAFFQRADNADNAIKRSLTPLSELAVAFDVTPITGLGLGANGNGSTAIMGTSGWEGLWWLHGAVFEVETARVMQEVGLFGFMLVYGMRLATIVVALRVCFLLRTKWMRSLAAAVAAFFVLHLGLFVVNNPTAGVFYWFSLGLVFALYRVDQLLVLACGRQSQAERDNSPKPHFCGSTDQGRGIDPC